MNNSPRTRWAAKGLLIASCLVVVFAGATAFKGKKPVYDPAESEAKLRKIGAALQLYRAEFGYRPVAERTHYSHAGLPPHLTNLIRPGHPWTLDLRDFQISDPRRVGTTVKVHFSTMYWGESLFPALGDVSRFFSARGEQLPILIDGNYEPFNPQKPSKEVLVLRLNGTVELISYDKNAGTLAILER